jgi:glycosyltransferase involved in cell wall biosynthesis
MIVKDESAVIERCLASVKPYIDYWVIVDTGSSDDTKERICGFLKDIPGELHERAWVNFAHNRNEALMLVQGKADYALIIDADEIFVTEPGFTLPPLTCDSYEIYTEFNGIRYGRTQLIRLTSNWKWEGVVHEVLKSSSAKTKSSLKGITNIPFTDGARSRDPLKYYKDARMIEEALKEDPNNSRYQFYLAQSYLACEELEKALLHFQKRITQPQGTGEEILYSYLQIGKLCETLNKPSCEITSAYLKAAQLFPWRAEPHHYLANFYIRNCNFEKSYKHALKGLFIPKPSEFMFIETNVYDYDLLFHFAVSAFELGRYTESLFASQLLLNKSLPELILQDTKRIAQLSQEKIKQTQAIFSCAE